MMAKRLLMIRRKFFDLIARGQKTLEVRVINSHTRHIHAGDIIIFLCGKNLIKALVLDVRRYGNFLEMLKFENSEKIAPMLDREGVLNLLRSIFSIKELLGVVVLEFEVFEIIMVKQKADIPGLNLFD